MNTTPMASRSIELLPLPFDRSWGLPELESALRSRNIPIPVGPTWDCLRPAIEQTAALLSANPRRAPWGSYLMVDEAARQVVGICAFKDAPVGGRVEIAYYTFPPHEGKGFATAAVVQLTEIAESSPEVQTVVARTLMEPNASTRVLTKCGFSLAGEVLDPEDGPVWQWEKIANHHSQQDPSETVHV